MLLILILVRRVKQHYDFHDDVIHISFNVMPGKNFLFKYQNFTEKKKIIIETRK